MNFDSDEAREIAEGFCNEVVAQDGEDRVMAAQAEIGDSVCNVDLA